MMLFTKKLFFVFHHSRSSYVFKVLFCLKKKRKSHPNLCKFFYIFQTQTQFTAAKNHFYAVHRCLNSPIYPVPHTMPNPYVFYIILLIQVSFAFTVASPFFRR